MNKKKIAIRVLMFLPLLMVLCVYGRLPDMVPTQWGIGGTVRYGEKIQIFLLPLLTIALAALFPLGRKIDPRNENFQKFSETYETLIILVLLLMTAVMGIVLSETFYPGRIPISKAIPVLIALLFIYLGNQTPKLRPNFFVGMKTPWALSNDLVWAKTQRLGGKLFFFGGFAMLLFAMLLPEIISIYFLLVLIVILVFVPSIMSYLWYQQEIKKDETDTNR